jgi:Rrf2 family protein
MKINKKTSYGLRAMIELAVHWEKESVFQKDISKKQEISFKYLDQIIAQLKGAGLITNTDGQKSGYRLLRKPELITVYDIYRAFESELAIVDCIENGVCKRDPSCAAREVWQGLNLNIVKHLNSFTLKSLADKQMILDSQKAPLVYTI